MSINGQKIRHTPPVHTAAERPPVPHGMELRQYGWFVTTAAGDVTHLGSKPKIAIKQAHKLGTQWGCH